MKTSQRLNLLAGQDLDTKIDNLLLGEDAESFDDVLLALAEHCERRAKGLDGSRLPDINRASTSWKNAALLMRDARRNLHSFNAGQIVGTYLAHLVAQAKEG